MKILIAKNDKKAGEIAAELIANELKIKPNLVLGLSTGSSPLSTYESLIMLEQKGFIDLQNVVTFNLDEYLGLSNTHPQSYYQFMNEKLFNKTKIKKANTHIPTIDMIDEDGCAMIYDEMIESFGGIDLQLLGIGTNGHIAFNEPGEFLNTYTSRVKLNEMTIEDNSRFFDSKKSVPTEAISMGIGSILKAKKIILLAQGDNKAETLKRLFKLKGKVTTSFPASFLFLHEDVTIICNKNAVEE